tara:strand:+ start:2381 stop:2482 length:102 start_codon:yes stop_codon:yes gene_type:complete
MQVKVQVSWLIKPENLTLIQQQATGLIGAKCFG